MLKFLQQLRLHQSKYSVYRRVRFIESAHSDTSPFINSR